MFRRLTTESSTGYLLRLLPVGLLLALSLVAAEDQSILTSEELALLGHESEMWRTIRTDKDMSDNIELLRKRGFTEVDLAWFRPKMEVFWQLPGYKSIDILGSETQEKIEEVERAFVKMYRDMRRFEESGVRPTSGQLYTKEELNLMWRKAIIKALSYEEARDYSLTRSSEAERVERLTQGMQLTSIERKELIKRARDFGDVDNAISQPRPTWLAYYEAQLEYYSGIRDLLGEDRFMRYLERANEEFRTIILALGDKDPWHMSLELFWLRRRNGIDIRKKATTPRERREINAEARKELERILGPSKLQIYLRSEHAKWLDF